MHTFLTADGRILKFERFLQGPKLGDGKVWNWRYDDVWVEEDSPHGLESDPNHKVYELHIFGEHHASLMRRQYK